MASVVQQGGVPRSLAMNDTNKEVVDVLVRGQGVLLQSQAALAVIIVRRFLRVDPATWEEDA